MRIYALSDLHIDYTENFQWLTHVSNFDYKNDILIFGGDLTNETNLLKNAFQLLKQKFSEVLFIPGNHDLWTSRSNENNSLEKLTVIITIASDYGIKTKPYHIGNLSLIPLHGWYDYSFGAPSQDLFRCWADFKECTWPDNLKPEDISNQFLALNQPHLNIRNKNIITFSHFLPRIDIMPPFIPFHKRMIYPVLGTGLLDEQIKKIGAQIHVYGHSHINTKIIKDNIVYINNAFGYPAENHISRKRLLCIYELSC